MSVVGGIPQGNAMLITVTFLDTDGIPFDPTSGIEIELRNPRGSFSTFDYPASLTKLGTGEYQADAVALYEGQYVAVGKGLLANGTPVTSQRTTQMVTPTTLV